MTGPQHLSRLTQLLLAAKRFIPRSAFVLTIQFHDTLTAQLSDALL